MGTSSSAMAQRCLFVFCIVMVTGCIAAPVEDQIVPEGTSLVDVTERGGCLSSYNNRYGACSKAYCDGKQGYTGCPCVNINSVDKENSCYDSNVKCNGGGFCVNCEPNMNGFAGCPCSKGANEKGTCKSQAGQGNDFECMSQDNNLNPLVGQDEYINWCTWDGLRCGDGLGMSQDGIFTDCVESCGNAGSPSWNCRSRAAGFLVRNEAARALQGLEGLAPR